LVRGAFSRSPERDPTRNHTELQEEIVLTELHAIYSFEKSVKHYHNTRCHNSQEEDTDFFSEKNKLEIQNSAVKYCVNCT